MGGYISIGKYCPVTGNQPMTCTKNGFIKSCEKFQLNLAMNKGQRSIYCGICLGTIPDNVTFINLPADKITTNEVSTMEKNTSNERAEKSGPQNKKNKGCYLCGQEKSLRSNFGKNLCSICQVLMMSARNHPELVRAAMREHGQDIPSEKVVDKLPAAELQAAQDRIVELEEMVNKFWQKPSVILSERGEVPGHNDVAWRLAIGIIVGSVTGVSIDDLNAIRGRL